MKWFIFFLILPHLKPASLEYVWPTLDTLFNIGRVISAIIILYLYLLKKRIPSKAVWILASLQIWILFTTYLHGTELWSAAINSVSILSVTLLIDLFIDRVKALLQGLMMNLEIILYANLLSVLLYFPNGLYISDLNHYKCYFIGYHNSFILCVMPAICVALLYISMTGRRLRPILLITVGCLSIIITWSATSICGLLIIGAMLFLEKSALRKWITFPCICAVALIADLAISVFRITDRVMWVAWFIEAFLRKQITLTGRVFIWDSFYQMFFESPWTGYGYGATIRATTGGIANHAHNQLFQMLLVGGIFALMLFLVFNITVGKRLMRYRQSHFSYVFLSMLAALYIIFIAETYSSPWLYMIYILAYHVDRLEAVLLSDQKPQQLIGKRYVQNRKITQKY